MRRIREKRGHGAPDLPPRLAADWLAFSELSTERRFQLAPVPYSSVRRWCRDEGMTAAEAERLRVIVRRLDDVVLKHHAERREAKR